MRLIRSPVAPSLAGTRGQDRDLSPLKPVALFDIRHSTHSRHTRTQREYPSLWHCANQLRIPASDGKFHGRQPLTTLSAMVPRLPASAVPGSWPRNRPRKPGCGGVQIRKRLLGEVGLATALGNALATLLGDPTSRSCRKPTRSEPLHRRSSLQHIARSLCCRPR